MERIRVLIVDDHAVVRQGLRAFLESEEDIEIAGEAANGMEAVEMAERLAPALILMDLVMPGMDGATAITQISHNNPASRILVLTSFGEEEKLHPAIQAGARGYLLKDTEPEDLSLAIRCVARGNYVLDGRLAERALSGQLLTTHKPSLAPMLTPREVDVLILLAQGQTNKQIAQVLNISIKTAKTHVSSILTKLNVTDRTQAALYAQAEGLVGKEKPSG